MHALFGSGRAAFISLTKGIYFAILNSQKYGTAVRQEAGVIVGVVDGQGGGIGAHVVERLRKALPEQTEIIALGTNAIATSAMMKAGANKGASGENAIRQTAPRLDIITGALAILQPHSMLGEITPAMVEALVQSRARKILMPLKSGEIELVGLKDEPIPHLIEELVLGIDRIVRETYNV